MTSKLALTSVVFGLLALVTLRMHVGRLEARIAGGGLTRVLALTADVSAGGAITREALTTRELPQAFRESRHIAASDFEQVIGAHLAVGVRANETLQWTDLAGIRPKLRQLSLLVPHGMRAMTLQAQGLGTGALIRPGDRVDVLRTTSSSNAELVLQDVVVLAVGSDIGGGTLAPASHGPAARGGAITVSVTLEQSGALARAEQLGPLRLVLRNPDDIASSAGAVPAFEAPTGEP